MKVGVLAVQGAFAEHEQALNELGIECVELRQKSDLKENISGLVFPGGESTVQGKLIRELDMYDTIKNHINEGMPVLATCAGLILLADNLSNDPVVHIGTLPVTVKRNAYGRQLGSFATDHDIKIGGQTIADFPMRFIRAPYIESTADDVEVCAEVDGNTVMVRYKNQLALSFHPELTKDYRIHQIFKNML